MADRRELAKQALSAFKEYLPDALRCWIEGGDIDKAARIHLATYPGMMGLYRQLSPGYHDLIVCDESHRSIYHRYKALLDHFDAITLGLTATPIDFIDRETFELFDCENGLPTKSYAYDEALRDRYLVPYLPVHVARTGFQIEGLKPGELPEEVRAEVASQGAHPDDLSFEGTDLERKVSNTGTNDAIVREFEEKADFLIIDHWGSFSFFQVSKDGREPSVTVPLPTRLFRRRRLLRRELPTPGRGHGQRLAEDNPALQRLRQGQEVDDADLDAIAGLLAGPDLFVTEARLREAYEQPSASFADFLRHIPGQARLPDREAVVYHAFDDWVMHHPKLGATQLLFFRTLSHALIQHAEIATLESLRQPPFSSIGDPQKLFEPQDLDEILDLALSLAA